MHETLEKDQEQLAALKARGRVDLLSVLAVVHHLVVKDWIPPSRVMDLTRERMARLDNRKSVASTVNQIT
jgi:hypothetical protein